MRSGYLVSLGFVVLLSARVQGRPTSRASESSSPTQSAQTAVEGPLNSPSSPYANTSEIPYTKDKRLSYAGYAIAVERKRVKVEGYTAENEMVVVRKKGKFVGAFDAVRHPLGAFARLALTPLLGDRQKILVIEQTGPRDWACWVIALKPRFRVVFTNLDYPVDHELRAEDLDGDGVPELLMTLNTFWFFDGLCGACSPRFDIAFKYGRKRGVYRPSNHTLKGLCDTPDELAQAEQQMRVWQSENPDYPSNPIKASELYSKLLIHSLPLIYCGNEALGWSFFDRLYNLPDRAVRKLRIKRALRRDRVYRVIQFDLKRTRRAASLHRARVSG